MEAWKPFGFTTDRVSNIHCTVSFRVEKEIHGCVTECGPGKVFLLFLSVFFALFFSVSPSIITLQVPPEREWMTVVIIYLCCVLLRVGVPRLVVRLPGQASIPRCDRQASYSYYL